MADNRKHSLAMGGRKPGLRGKLPVLSTTGPISIWMIIFVMLPLIYVLVISFMARNVYGGIEPTFTLENYTTMLQPLYLKIIVKSSSWHSLQRWFVWWSGIRWLTGSQENRRRLLRSF